MTLVIATTGGGYVAAAYVVFIALILLYLVIMAVKTSRIERELKELGDVVERRSR